MINTFMKLKEILNEATFDTNSIVDEIYNNNYKEYFDAIKNWMYDKKPLPKNIESLKRGGILDKEFFDRFFKKYRYDERVKEAYDINPVVIELEKNTQNYYKPSFSKRPSKISINVNSVVEYVIHDVISMTPQQSYKDAVEYIISSDTEITQKNFVTEMTGMSVRKSIAHEISHWLDDTFHNSNIKNKLRNRKLTNKYKHISITSHEIDANIHAIKEIKRHIPEIRWNEMSLYDLLANDPSLKTIYDGLKYDKQKLKVWLRLLFKRMNREGLLGRNMKLDSNLEL